MSDMHNISGPFDFQSFGYGVVGILANITVPHLNAHWMLQVGGILVTYTGLAINVIKLVEWFRIKFLNKNEKK